jgi:hypothetical protein
MPDKPGEQARNALAATRVHKKYLTRSLDKIADKLTDKAESMKASGEPFTEIQKVMNQRDKVQEQKDRIKFGIRSY